VVVVLGAENLAVVYDEDEDGNRKRKKEGSEENSTKNIALDRQTS